MTDTLKGSETLAVCESRAREIAKKIFAKHNPEAGDLFSFQATVEKGYLAAGFSMMVESDNPEDRLVVIIARDWDGEEDAKHTMITIGQYDESRFYAKIPERQKQIEIDILSQSYNAKSQDVVRFDWRRDGRTSAGTDEVTSDRAQELLQMAEDMIHRDGSKLIFSKTEDKDVLRK